MSREQRSRIAVLIGRAGWWGTCLFAAALFFLTGSLISFFEGDLRIALQSFAVALALWAVTLLIYHKRPATKRFPE